MLRAIVLAAGASTRMGRPKAALPLSDRADTFLSRLVRTLTTAGLPEIVVVTGSHAEVVRRAAGRMGAPVRFAHNAAWPDGQLASLLVGLHHPPADLLEGVLVTLVDSPLVAVPTVAAVTAAWRRERAPITRPSRGDEHGHPVIFDAAVFDALRAADPAQGAKTVVRAHAEEILNVAVDDPGAFLDMDTEREYRVALGRLRR